MVPVDKVDVASVFVKYYEEVSIGEFSGMPARQ
jgi:hypothetical protein